MFILRIAAAVCCASLLWTTDCWYQETAAPIKQIQDVQVETVSSILKRVRELSAKGDLEEALQQLNLAIGHNPDSVALHLERANTFMGKMDLESCIRDLDFVLNFEPANVIANGMKGNALLLMKSWDEAIKYLSRSIEQMPTPIVHYDRAYCWRQKGELQKAIEDYSEAIKLQPSHELAFSERGEVWQVLGEYKNAISDLERSLSINPDNVRAALQIAWILATCPDDELRDGKRAQKMAGEVCDPETCQTIEPLQVLAATYAEEENYDWAIKLQERANALSYFAPEFRENGLRRLETFKANKPIRSANEPVQLLERQLQTVPREIQIEEALDVPAEVLARAYLNVKLLLVSVNLAKAGVTIQSWLDGQPFTLNTANVEEAGKLLEQRMAVYKRAVKRRGYKKLGTGYRVSIQGDCDDWAISSGPILFAQDGFDIKIAQETQAIAEHEGVIIESTIVFEHERNSDVLIAGAIDDGKIIFTTPEKFGLTGMATRRCTATLQPEELGPDWYPTVLRRAMLRMSNDHFQSAIDDCTKAIKLNPDMPEAWFLRALMRASSPDESVRNGELAVSDALRAKELISDDEVLIMSILAAAYAEAGEFDNAVIWQKKALEIAPEFVRPELQERLKLFKANKPYRFALD